MNAPPAWTARPDLFSRGSFLAPDYVVASAWLEHGPFMAWLMERLAPRCFVELGTHSGFSYFAACQTVKRLGLPTSCHAVDTWQGDEHAGFYDESVYAAVHVHNETHFPAFSRLIRATFADATTLFAERSIDLLHLDGRHFYEDARDDLALWRDKLAPDAILLMHDTNVRERDFGVWRLFHELSQDYRTFEFVHGHGLGVVALGRIPPTLAALFDGSDETVATLRTAYSSLGRAVTQRWQLAEMGREAAQREAAHAAAQQEVRASHDAALAAAAARHDAAFAAEQAAHASALDASRIAHAASLDSAAASHVAALHASKAAHAQQIESLTADAAGRFAAAVQERDQEIAAGKDERARAETRLWAQHATIERLLAAERKAASDLSEAHAVAEAARAETLRLTASLSWQLTSPLRRLFDRSPRLARVGLSAARLLWRLATFRFGLVAASLRARRALRREEAEISADPMFDAAFYRQHYPRVVESGLSPARHYLVRGRFAGYRPHPLFDPEWYRGAYPDIGDDEPLIHYIRRGRSADRAPNAFFDPAWYRLRHPELGNVRQDPVQHFLAMGAEQRADPSPRFPVGTYLDRYQDVAESGANPLAHYLLHGLREGRDISSLTVDASRGEPVEQTPIECRKRPGAAREAALFVTHSGNGRLKPHMRHYLAALKAEGIAVTLIIAADRGFAGDEDWLYDLVDGLYVRDNAGWDFAAWAHVLRLNPQFYAAEMLYWMNDSLIGPVNQAALHAVVERIRGENAGLVGLTINHERGRHVQSYFLAFKETALRSYVFHDFVLDVRAYADKEDVINAYEIKLGPLLENGGVSVTALFEPSGPHNPTLFEWSRLLAEGFPFLKVLAITHDGEQWDKTGWREALHQHGYDVLLADALLAEKTNPNALPFDRDARPHRPALPADPPTLAFIGPFNYGNGLGVAARGYLSALMHVGLPTSMLPIERPFHIHQRVTPTLPCTAAIAPPDVAVVHLNPESWAPLLTPAQDRLIASARHRIGLFVWESETLPPGFAERMQRLSAVWAPSEYCARAFRNVSRIPVHVVPHVVPLTPERPASARQDGLRRSFGFAATERVVLFTFDASSYIERKNPAALLRAFERAGIAGAGWRLLLKTKHLREAGAAGDALGEAVARVPGALLVDRMLSVDAAARLLDLADIYVSPHCSEGFGLTIAEAMARGKPVIATDFGGVTDFLDSDSGFPVRCSPWELPADNGAYPAGTVWGKIDEDALTETIARVAAFTGPERAEVAARARARIASQLSPAAVGACMRRSIDAVLGRN